MRVTPQECTDHVKDCIMAGLVPMISGDPGIGKSDIMQQVFDHFQLKMIDIRLSQYDPTELNGYPSIKDGRATHTPLDTFPLGNDKLPPNHEHIALNKLHEKDKDWVKLYEIYQGWGIFFDEFNSSSLAVQAAAYKVILNHCVGQHPLHKRAVSACAGNLTTNNAIVNRMSTAMQSRLVHYELMVDVAQWVQWANTKGLDHRVIAYIQHVPKNLHNFDPDHDDKTFACPRTWEFTSRLIKRTPGALQPKLPSLAGTVSEAIAQEFIIYTDIYTDIPTIQEILAQAETITISQEPGILYALSNMVAAWSKPDNIDVLMKFITRLPIEFATITIQNMLHRNPELYKEDPIAKWIEITSPDIF